MATAKFMLPSKKKALFLKYTSLMHDGGKLVLLKQCTIRSSPDLVTELSNHRSKLKTLLPKKVISQKQYDLIYPKSGYPDTSKFDVTLLSCLLHNIFKVNDPKQQPPAATDTTVGADVFRLRRMRNDCFHPTKTEMTEQEFKRKWQELEEVLLRLGNGVSDLQTTIDELKQNSIDPDREKELLDQIAIWKTEYDNLVKEMKTDMSDVKEKVQNLEDGQEKLYQRVTTTEKASKTMADQFSGLQEDIQEVQKSVQRFPEMHPKLKHLASLTKMELDDVMNDKTYVRTEQYKKAKSILQQRRVLFISGHPGEGKTTMARKLACEVSPPDRCLELSKPSHWEYIDSNAKQFDTLLIDDIFGAGALDQSLARQWERSIVKMHKVSQKRKMNIIITTRHYILEGAHSILKKIPIFDEEHVINLSSESLNESEMVQILQNKLKESGRDYDNIMISECVSKTNSYFVKLFGSGSNDFVFGYPQCARMFVKNDNLFQRGSEYFSQPKEFFKDCVEDLYKKERRANFLALILIWSKSDRTLKESELHPSKSTNELKSIAQAFGYALNQDLVLKVRKFLKDLQGGFLDYNASHGSYQFNHHVIEDVIGIVLSEDYPEAVLRYATRDFILRYVTTDSLKDDDFHFFVKEHLYEDLAFQMLKLFLKPQRQSYLGLFPGRTKGFESGGRSPNQVNTNPDIDVGLVTSDAFKKERFLESFVKCLQKDDSEKELKSLPVIDMKGHFLGYGIHSDCISIFLPEYFLQNENSLLIKEMLKQKTKWGNDRSVLDVALLIAAHRGCQDIVESLIKCGARVSEEAKYIAAVSKNTHILPFLMPSCSHLDKFKIMNGNSALIACSKRGLLASVQALICCGADIHYRNEKGLSALDKAVLFDHADICKILLKAGVEVDKKVQPFKRTPLHTACDKGFVDVVEVLLQYGSKTDIQDHRGHYAIHCAAFQGHTDVVQKLLQYDVLLAKQRIISYGSHSKIKGMTVFHIAVWKNNLDMLNMLLQSGADPSVRDCYGRTPLYYAAQAGKASHVEALIPVLSPNEVNKQGLTPLHAALTWKHMEVVRLLLPVTDVNTTDKRGETPLHIACKHDDTETVKLLVEDHHADVRMKTRKGHSVFDILKPGQLFDFFARYDSVMFEKYCNNH